MASSVKAGYGLNVSSSNNLNKQWKVGKTSIKGLLAITKSDIKFWSKELKENDSYYSLDHATKEIERATLKQKVIESSFLTKNGKIRKFISVNELKRFNERFEKLSTHNLNWGLDSAGQPITIEMKDAKHWKGRNVSNVVKGRSPVQSRINKLSAWAANGEWLHHTYHGSELSPKVAQAMKELSKMGLSTEDVVKMLNDAGVTGEIILKEQISQYGRAYRTFINDSGFNIEYFNDDIEISDEELTVDEE